MTAKREREKPKSKEKTSPPKRPSDSDKALRDDALRDVTGGLNPQPLPPLIHPT